MSNGKNKNIITEKGRRISLSPVRILEKPYFEAAMLRRMQIVKEIAVNM
jgi:hypothetical protein